MSYLYYENLPDVKTENHAKVIMESVYSHLYPYRKYYRSMLNEARKKVFKVTVELFVLEDLLSEEVDEFINEVSEEDKDQDFLTNDKFLNNLDRQLKNIIKLMKNGRGLLYQILDNSDEEDFDRIKDQFLSSEEVFISRNFSDGRRFSVLTSYSPYDILLIERSGLLIKKGEKFNLYLRPNYYQFQMIENSVNILQNRPVHYNRNLIRLLEKIDWVEFNEMNNRRIEELDWVFLSDNNRKGTNTQREFVDIALNTPDFAILEGPPGSGKTTTICEIIYQAIKRGMRILLVASTHVAVDNVLEKLMDEHSDYYDEVRRNVLPIRIGRSDRLSDLATNFHAETFWKSEKKRLRKFYESFTYQSKSQKMMFELLGSESPRIQRHMKNVFIRAANLVCGTTIGILRHPEIQAIRRGETSRFPYDLLILDEASKTTFQEFLVPSLLAERFIIVGDIKQLSPYVEEEGLSTNLFLKEIPEFSWIALLNNIKSSEKSNSHNYLKYLILLKDELSNKVSEFFQSIVSADIPTYMCKENVYPNIIELMGATIIVISEKTLPKYQKYLPSNIRWINLSESSKLISSDKLVHQSTLDEWVRTYRYAQRNHKSLNDIFNNDRSWHEAVSWRLVRDFELRFIEVENRYKKEIEELIPSFLNEEIITEIGYDLMELKRLTFPSIIELLQKGFNRNQYQKTRDWGTCLTDGIPEEILLSRHKILQYQHRMHPEISKFPREMFYDEKALIDLPDIESERQLHYPYYNNQVLWLDVPVSRSERHSISKRYKNSNIKEVNAIIDEIRTLMESKKLLPKPDGKPWEIALLPFYRGQERLLRTELRKLFRSNRKRTFVSKDKSITVQLCVVDRFQGHEADIVFLSLVRTGGVGFLDNPNRLNVALTRAKYQLVIVGNKFLFEKRQNKSMILKELAERTLRSRIYR